MTKTKQVKPMKRKGWRAHVDAPEGMRLVVGGLEADARDFLYTYELSGLGPEEEMEVSYDETRRCWTGAGLWDLFVRGKTPEEAASKIEQQVAKRLFRILQRMAQQRVVPFHLNP